MGARKWSGSFIPSDLKSFKTRFLSLNNTSPSSGGFRMHCFLDVDIVYLQYVPITEIHFLESTQRGLLILQHVIAMDAGHCYSSPDFSVGREDPVLWMLLRVLL